MAYQVLKRVFCDPKYAALALVTASVVFVFATWLPNLGFAWQVASSSALPLAGKIKVLAALVGSIATNFTLFSALSLVVVALLFGANVAMIAYGAALRRQIGQPGIAASLGGLVSGFAGIGCAACGTFLLAPVLSLGGATALIAVLPLGGQEFTLLGIALLGLSLFWTGKRLALPAACPAERKTRPRTSAP